MREFMTVCINGHRFYEHVHPPAEPIFPGCRKCGASIASVFELPPVEVANG